MLKKVIAGWNSNLGAPKGWNPETDGECNALPVRIHPPEAATGKTSAQYCESAWEPTPIELEWLNQGGQIVLRVVGWQVPVALYGEPPAEDAEHPLSTGFARGYAAALVAAARAAERTGSPQTITAIQSLMGGLKEVLADNLDADAAVKLDLKLSVCKQILPHAINALLNAEFFNTPKDPKAFAEKLREMAIESRLISFDDLHHAPRCPANHFHKVRMPTGRCTCGAQREADAQAATDKPE